MAPAARTADSVWDRLGQSVSGSSPAVWLNQNVLRHPGVAKTRGAGHRAWTRALDVGYPLIVLGRGAGRGVSMLLGRWKQTGKEKRRIEAVIALICMAALALLHYGPLLLVLGAVGGCAWLGRDTSRKGADPESPGHISKLQTVYNGLVPYLQNGDDPDQHFKPGGGYRDAFTAWEFDDQDRLIRLRLDYSEYFKDGQPDSRAHVERAIEGKIGQSNEFLYDWDEQGNHLEVRILPPLTVGIGAQPWPVADIEFVLGITDPDSSSRLIPVLVPDPEGAGTDATAHAAAPAGFRVEQLAPVVWRVASTDPHLLLSGAAGTGKSTAVRSLIGQALGRGHQIAVIDTGHTGQYAGLAGQEGVLRIAEQPAAWLELTDWFGGLVEQRAERLARLRALDASHVPAPEPFATGVPAAPAGAGDAPAPGALENTQHRLKAVQGVVPATGNVVVVPAADRADGIVAGTLPGADEPAELSRDADNRAAAESSNTAAGVGDSDHRGRGSQAAETAAADGAGAAEPHLWLFVDSATELTAAAAELGRPDPLETLAAIARKARFARATVVLTCPAEKLSTMRPLLLSQFTCRVALGRVDPTVSTLLFGGTLELGGAAAMPRGRGYAQIGLNGPVIRLQAPYAAPTPVPTAV